jgi:hypothetical protein
LASAIRYTTARFTEATKAEILAELAESKKDQDKYHLYNGVYHDIEKGCDFCIPHHTIFPARSNLLRHLHKKMMHHDGEAKVHDCFHGIMEHIHPGGSISTCVFYDPEEHEDALRGRYHLYGPELVENSQKCRYGDTVEKEREKKTTFTKNI